jgi:hypothetical protein
MATVAATLVSTYVLDAVATAVGLALVVSGMLAGAGNSAVLLFLAASYVAWGAGQHPGRVKPALGETGNLYAQQHQIGTCRTARQRRSEPRPGASVRVGGTEPRSDARPR